MTHPPSIGPLGIYGWFDFQDVYDMAVRRFALRPCRFVEVGCWEGCSTSWLAKRLMDWGSGGVIFAVDTWEGSYDQADLCQWAKDRDIYAAFLRNMLDRNMLGTVCPIRMDSVKAAKLFHKAELDFVFLDACHDYEAVKADIKAWLPKVRPGGILAGDDWENRLHPGVTQAAAELLQPIRQLGRSWVHEVM